MTEGHADTPPSPLSSSIEREPSATSSPASIVIGAARLDNVSTFPKSVAAVMFPIIRHCRVFWTGESHRKGG